LKLPFFAGETKDPEKSELPEAKGDEASEVVAEDNLRRAQYELLELVKQQGGLHIDADASTDLGSTSKIALVFYP